MRAFETAPAQRHSSPLKRADEDRPRNRLPPIDRLEDHAVSARFCERLALAGGLRESEGRALLELKSKAVGYHAGGMIADEFDPLPVLVIVSGWASAQRILEDGRRQVFDILAPGDSIGLWPANLKAITVSFVALTPLVAADAAGLRKCGAGRIQGLSEALSIEEQKMESRLYDHIVRLGRRSGLERVADFVLEIYLRLIETRCTTELRFPFPLTQEVLADFLGLTPIHVNRTLRQMRQIGLAKIASGWLEIENLNLLRSAARDANKFIRARSCAGTKEIRIGRNETSTP
jgi:CRP-like cAMP-binding protein